MRPAQTGSRSGASTSPDAWDEPIGKQIGRPGGRISGRVIGVVEDFHFWSLHDRIVPFVVFRGDGDYSELNPVERALAERLMIINVAQEGLRDTLRYIEGRFTWNRQPGR